jgi:hypothetical protein
MEKINKVLRTIGKTLLSVLCLGVGAFFILLCMGTSDGPSVITICIVIILGSLAVLSLSLIILIWEGKAGWLEWWKGHTTPRLDP